MNTDQLFGSLSGMTISQGQNWPCRISVSSKGAILAWPICVLAQSASERGQLGHGTELRACQVPILWVVVVPRCVDLHNPLGEIVKTCKNIYFDF